MSGRDPDAVLAALGHDLRAAWAKAPARSRSRLLRAPRRGAVLVLLALALVPTALATRDAIWAPELPRLPETLRGPGSVAPTRAGAPVYVAAGRSGGVAWRLSATACDYRGTPAVGLYLEVPGGGAGARCDVASRLPGGVSPQALANRRLQSYYDPLRDRTWWFGALPAGARTVDLVAGATPLRAAAVPASADAVTRGGLPAGLRVFVAVADGSPGPATATIFDASGAPLLQCARGGCLPPTPR